MRILIAGVDGYLGWALAQHLAGRGHAVAGVDNFFRREWVDEMDSTSAIPISPMEERLQAFRERFGEELRFWRGDLRHADLVARVFEEFAPDAVVHLGECPSAPYSMRDPGHARFVQENNLGTTFSVLSAIYELAPETHLVKLGTMGEYGTPNIDIPEGFFEIEYRGRRDRLPFPRQAGSWYHWSKVHGSNNIMFAARVWGIRATDVMQGVVFGTRILNGSDDPRFRTRLDFDQAFGTAVNRFCCQAVVGHPLTPYGKGHQRRGFLPLRDSMQCLTLALENPPKTAEYRVFNQFQEVYDLTDLALTVQRVASQLDLDVDVRNVENPRIEAEEHHYQPDHEHLFALGYEPTQDVESEIRDMIEDLRPHRTRIAKWAHAFLPDVRWDGRTERVEFLSAPAREEYAADVPGPSRR